MKKGIGWVVVVEHRLSDWVTYRCAISEISELESRAWVVTKKTPPPLKECYNRGSGACRAKKPGSADKTNKKPN